MFTNLNGAHIHLMLNHLPVVGLPIVLFFLLWAVIRDNREMKQASLFFLVFLGVASIAVFLTGEPAEEVVEHLQGVSENLIESHEDLGKLALIATLITAASALYSYLRELRGFRSQGGVKLVLVFGLLATLALGATANLGGKIRHSEIRQNELSENKQSLAR